MSSYQSIGERYGGDEARGPLLSDEREEFHSFGPSSSSSSSSSVSPSSPFSSFTPRQLKLTAIALAVFLTFALLLHSSSRVISPSSISSSSSLAAELTSAALSERGHGHHHSSDSYATHHHSHPSHHSHPGRGSSEDDSDPAEERHSRNSQHGHRTPPPADEGEEEEVEKESPSSSPSHQHKPSHPSHSNPSHSHPSSHSHPTTGLTNIDDEMDATGDIERRNQETLRNGGSPFVGNNPDQQTPQQVAGAGGGGGGRQAGPGSPLTGVNCEPPYPGYPYCESKVNELMQSWRSDSETEAKYRAEGVDGGKCSFLTYLNRNGFFCPEATDYNRGKIRGVNLGGWLVLEPWIKPSLFTQFAVEDGVKDQWTFCEKLGSKEAKKQLEQHWDTWLTKADLQALAEGGINHVRIPVGYWIFGDVQDGEPWVTGDLAYLERGLRWIRDLGLHAILDLHCAPGSQNGFDNSGRFGEVHFADSETQSNGRVLYPNIERALTVIDALTKHFSTDEYKGTVVGIELVNEAFISIPLEIVKDYYVQGYEVVKKYGDLAVVIGDSFRFGSWGDFMFPPHYRHVWIDTHIYQVFDAYHLSFTQQQHVDQTCTINKPEVAVAPLSTMVGEWSLATFDCARWLNGYNQGARYDGTYSTGKEQTIPLGSCKGQNDIHDTSVWTPEYRQFLLQFAEVQMDAYESGSSAGWFFWNFKTEGSPQWDYLLGLRQGWIPKDHNNRKFNCDNSQSSSSSS